MARIFGSTFPLPRELQDRWDQIVEEAALRIVEHISKGRKMSLVHTKKVLDIAARSPRVKEALATLLAAKKTQPATRRKTT